MERDFQAKRGPPYLVELSEKVEATRSPAYLKSTVLNYDLNEYLSFLNPEAWRRPTDCPTYLELRRKYNEERIRASLEQAQTHHLQGDFPAALATINRVLQWPSSNNHQATAAHLLRARLQFDTGQYELAFRDLEAILRHDSNHVAAKALAQQFLAKLPVDPRYASARQLGKALVWRDLVFDTTTRMAAKEKDMDKKDKSAAVATNDAKG
ncbi:hypothetical protein IWQ60_010105 [Tieghemiomyces parasiticus]|uniref:Uncharacterized protein n=1 Tax=Tieghemiomyces parasiticus TaxID=78921 RepID=A0A9W8DNE6_9FUNG|nr:hypothetical protein IWQ60_010105 [Tieghemiomyces parasiticus]